MASGLDLKFISAYKLCPPESKKLCQLLEQIDGCGTDVEYKRLIDEIVTKYVEEHGTGEGNYIRNIVITCFYKTSARKNIRRYMYDKFNKATIGENNVLLFEYIMSNLITEVQENINNLNIFNIGQCFNILCFLGSYVQCLNLQPEFVYVLEQTLPFFMCILDVFTSQFYNVNFCRDDVTGKGILEYRDCYTVLDICLGQLSSTLPRAQFMEGIRCFAVKMVILCHDILLTNTLLKFETICKTAVVISYFTLHLPDEEKESLKYKDYPVVDFLDNPDNNYCLALQKTTLRNIFDTDAMKVVLHLSIYTSVITSELVSLQYQGKPMLVSLFNNLFNFGMQMSDYPERMQPISCTLMGLAKHIPLVKDYYSELYQNALTFAWTYLEYNLDTVVRNTKKMVSCIVNDAGLRHVNGDDEQLDMFFDALKTKSIFSKVYLSALLCASTVLHCDIILKKCKSVQINLLTLMTTTSDHDLACQIYTTMMNVYLKLNTEETLIITWLRPVLAMLRRPKIRHHGVLEGIVTQAFQQKPGIFRKLFSSKTVGTVRECVVILKCVHFARLQGFDLPLEEDANPADYWRNLLIRGRLELFMVHQEDDIRITTLQVIAECHKSTEEFTEWELQYLLRYLQLNVAPQSPASRNRIVTYFKKIIQRHYNTHLGLIRRITSMRSKLEKAPTSARQRAEHDEAQKAVDQSLAVIKFYDVFSNQFMRLLVFYLSPDGNHSRRSTCLELLIYAHGYTSRADWLSYFQPDEVNCVKHILHDNYESNKELAVKLLRTLPPETIGFDNEENTRKFYELGVHMAGDTRPSQSVSASYMFQVVLLSEYDYKNHDKTYIAIANNKQSLMLLSMSQELLDLYTGIGSKIVAVSRATPLYGMLLSCRNLLRHRDIREGNKTYTLAFYRLASLCLDMSRHIMPVVCNSAPEGRLDGSDESDDSFLESEQSCRSQKVLVYSWKTMREIMLLLAEIANQTVTLENVMEMLAESYLLRIGDFFVDVFISTKHRGVFEQAHAAFLTVCRSYLHSNKPNLNRLPRRWLNYAIGLCTGVTVDPRISSTRRSAGLPFLILSILPTLAGMHREYVRRTVEPLLLKAQTGEDDEQRVHCLNVLRFIFKNSKLTENLKRYVDRGTIAALEGYRSRAWGVRNAATLLLATLVTKIFGVPNKTSSDSELEETRLTIAAFAFAHRVLFDFLLRTLEEECENTHSLILHPVMLILSRLYPSFNQNINEQVQRYIRCINVCIRNPSYRTRDLAARASVSLISEQFLNQQLTVNFNRISKKYIKDTECHGLLLQIAHIFNTAAIQNLPISHYLESTKHLLSEAGLNYSHMTVALYMDIVFIMLSRYRDFHNIEVLKKIIVLLDHQDMIGVVTTSQTSFTYSRFQLFVCILVTKFEHVDETYAVLNQMIIACLYGGDLEMKKKVLQLLIYLNQEFSDDQFKEHPLFVSGDVEICPQIKALVHSFDFKSKKEMLTHTHPFLLKYFFAELYANIPIPRDYLVLVFLLMRFYPCFFRGLITEQKQTILNLLMFMAKRRNEELTSSVISSLRVFLMTLTVEELKGLDYVNMMNLLIDSAAPSAADFRRLAVAQFLVGTQALYKNKIFHDYDRYNILNLIMILLEDDEALVRNTMSEFPTKRNKVLVTKTPWQVVPNKARNTLALTTTYDFQNEVAICCLASWALRRLPQVTRDTSEVYDRGELNPFAENIPVTHAMSRALHSLLWNVTNFEEHKTRSIFLEEQAYLVSDIMIQSLLNAPSPMMDIKTKRTVICVFKSILKFVEDIKVGEDFLTKFKVFFNSKILKFLRNSLGTDYSSTKAFLTYLYNPLLNAHRQFP